MKTKNLFYAMAMGVAFTACSQEEIATDSVNLQKGESFKNYVGEKLDANLTFTKDGDVESRMAVNNGAPSWIDGDMVGLVWTNAIVEGEPLQSPWTDKPATPHVFSNTRMTYDANEGNGYWYMTDGQIFKGMYLAYYPYNEAIQSVQQFAVSQDNEQTQTNSTTETLNGVAEKLVWMSQRYEDDEDVSKNATFVYPFTVDNIESGTGSNINVRMKPFSNILDARFNITKHETPAIDLNPEVVTVKDVKLVLLNATNGTTHLTVWPTTAKFDLSKWGWEWEVKSEGPSGLDGRKLTIENHNNGYEGTDKVSSINVHIDNAVANGGNLQRANFMFLPYDDPTANDYKTAVYAVRVETDYGYVYIEESEWKKAATNNGGLMVNPTEVSEMAPVQASNMMNTLTDRIGMQAVRYFNVYAQDFIYDNITVKNTNDLVEAIRKFNVLGKSGKFNVVVDADNNFEDLVWSEAATVEVDGETWNTPEAIQEFLANPANQLKMNATTPVVLNDAAIDDANTLLLNDVTVQSEGKLQVTVDQVFEKLNTTAGSELIIPSNGKVSVEYPSTFAGNTTVDQLAELHINDKASIDNDGEFSLNGTLHIAAFADVTKFINDGTFNLYKHGNLLGVAGLTRDQFINNGTFNYVENGTNTDVDFVENGMTVAEINDDNKSTALSNYIQAASEFGCTTLNILTSSNLEAEWDNTVADLNFAAINLADGVTLKLAKEFNATNAVVTISGEATIETVNTIATTALNISGLVLEAGSTLNITDTLLDINVGNIEMKGESGKTTTLNGIAQTNKAEVDIVKASSGTYEIQ